jgi:hypothetical protein
MLETDQPIEKFDDHFSFRCYKDELKRWRKLFKSRNCSLGNFVRDLVNKAAEKKVEKNN